MPYINSINVEFTPVSGDWGTQLGWVSAPVPGAFRGLIVHRMPVFRRADTCGIDFGMPLAAGAVPGTRHSCVTFDTDRHRKRFLGALEAALRQKHPELFPVEMRS